MCRRIGVDRAREKPDVVTPTAFEALGVPPTRGRTFNSGDVPDGLQVAVVNEGSFGASIRIVIPSASV